MNICPADASEENGSVELWPGSHMVVGVDGGVDTVTEEARRKIAPPVRGNMKKGSVLIRDARLWHRGVPNPSDRPRHIIAMVYNIRWLRRGKPLLFGKGCEAAFISGDLDPNVEFTDEPIDYLSSSIARVAGQSAGQALVFQTVPVVGRAKEDQPPAINMDTDTRRPG